MGYEIDICIELVPTAFGFDSDAFGCQLHLNFAAGPKCIQML
jgi:hypothetical protein